MSPSNHMQMIIDLIVNEQGLNKFTANAKAQMASLEQAARTPGSGAVTGLPGTGHGTTLASRTGLLSGEIELARSLLPQLQKIGKISQAAADQFKKDFPTTGPNAAIPRVAAALGERTIGKVPAARFETQARAAAAAEYDQARKIVAQRQAEAEDAKRTAAAKDAAAQESIKAESKAVAATAAQTADREKQRLAAKAYEEKRQKETQTDSDVTRDAVQERRHNLQKEIAFEKALLKDPGQIGLVGDLASTRQRRETLQGIDIESKITPQDIQSRGELIAMRRKRTAQERAAAEKALVLDADYIRASAEEINAKRQRSAAVRAQALGGAGLVPPGGAPPRPPGGGFVPGPEDYGTEQMALIRQEAANNVATMRERLTRQKEELDLQSKHNVPETQGNVDAQRKVLSARRLATEHQALQGDTKALDAIAMEQASRNQLNRVLKVRTAAAERALFAEQKLAGTVPAMGGGKVSWFQKFQSGIAERQGNFRDPTEFMRLGQFMKARFLTTAGFAVSGIATYAAFSGLANMVKEGAKLERILVQIKAQFDSIDEAGAFPQFQQGIMNIAKETGEAASEVATIAFQFKGAFSDTMSNTKIMEQVQSAVEITRITGLSLTEVTDSLTASAITFGTNVEHVGDVALALQERTGVLAKETIQFVADLAPVAKQVGLSLEEISSLAAVAQQTSGRSATAIAEGFNRVFPAMQENATDIIAFFEQSSPSAVDGILKSFSAGETGKVFLEIQKMYGGLSKAQQNYVISMLGGRREAQNLIGVLENYDKTLNATRAATNSAGKTHEYFEKVQETLTQSFARLGQQVRQFGVYLLKAGISDAFQNIANALGVVVGLAGGVLSFFARLNEATGGMVGKFLMFAAAAKAVSLSLSALAGMKTLGFLGAATTKGAAAAGAAAGIGPVPTAGPPGMGASATAGLIGRAGFMGLTWGSFGALAAVAAMTAYMGLRNKFSGQAEKELERLQKMDRDDLKRLAAQKEDAPTRFGKWITGQKTLPELAEDAVQSTDKRLNTALNDLIAALEARKQDTTAVEGMLADLTDNKKYDEAVLLTENLPTLSKIPKAEVKPFIEVAGDLELMIPGNELSDAANITAETFENIEENLARVQELQEEYYRASGVEDVEKAGLALEEFTMEKFDVKHVNVDEVRATMEEWKIEIGKGTFLGLDFEEALRLAEILKGMGVNVAGITGEMADLAKQAADSQALEEIMMTLDQARAEFKVGGIGPQMLKSKLDEAIESTKKQIKLMKEDLARGKGDPTLYNAALGNLATLESEKQQLAADIVQKRIEISVQAAETTGQTPKVVEPLRQQAIQTELTTTKDLTFEKRMDLANQYLESQKAWVQFAADEAGSESEALAIIRQGLAIPDFIKSILVEQQLRALADAGGTTLEAVASAVDIEYGTFVQFIAGLSTSGIIAVEKIRAILAARIAQLKFTLDNMRRFGESVGKLGKEYMALQKVYAAIPNFKFTEIPDIATVASPTSSESTASSAKEIAEARLAILEALNENDPFALAQIALQKADVAAQYATNEAERLNALAERYKAQHGLQQAIFDIVNAYSELAITLADSAGETIRAGELSVQLAQQHIDQARAMGVPEHSVEMANLQGELASAQASAADAALQERLDVINFQMDMGKMTKAQAIAQLQLILANKDLWDLSAAETRSIQEQIHSLRQQLGSDLKMNVPDEIRLPGLYEVRRLNQTGGSNNYQDNRRVSIVVTTGSGDPKAIANEIQKSFSVPPRWGSDGRLYVG